MQKPLESLRLNTAIVKILLLYLSTSAVFFGILFFIMHEKEIHSLRTKQMIQMRNDYITIMTHLAQDNNIESGVKNALEKVEMPFAVIDVDNNVLFSNLSIPFNQIPIPKKRSNKHSTETSEDMHYDKHNDKQKDKQHLTKLERDGGDRNDSGDKTDRRERGYSNKDLKDSKEPRDSRESKGAKEYRESKDSKQKDQRYYDIYDSGFYCTNDYIFIDFRENKSIEHILTRPPLNLARQKMLLRHIKMPLRVIIQGVNIPSFQDPKPPKMFKPLSIKSIQNEIFYERIEIILSVLASLLGVGVVAYFLVKLSLRPIQEKFDTLGRFIKDSTHEINTPLSVILLSVQKIDEKNLSESNRKKINHIKLAAQNLNHLYQNLIFFNFYNKTLPQESLDLARLMRQRLDYFSPLLAQKSIHLSLDIKQSTILSNIDEMRILIDNLLSNAIKYNNKNGRIIITLKQGFLSVKDSGYGMPKEVVSNIFERYSRFNNAQGGFGIGLSLVKEICERYNIQIQCESVLDKGSIFRLSW